MTDPTVGVHETVKGEAPPEMFCSELSADGLEVRVVRNGDGSIGDCDAVITSLHSEEFLEG